MMLSFTKIKLIGVRKIIILSVKQQSFTEAEAAFALITLIITVFLMRDWEDAFLLLAEVYFSPLT